MTKYWEDRREKEEEEKKKEKIKKPDCMYYVEGGYCVHKFNTDIRGHGTHRRQNKKKCNPEFCPID